VRLVYGKHTIHVRGEPQFVIYHRREFDAYLAAEAARRGVQISQNENVQSVQRSDAGMEIRTNKGTYSARAVIGADGSKGISRRKLNQVEKRRRVARLLEYYVPGEEDAPLYTDHYAIFDFTPAAGELQGYVWDFPSYVEGVAKYNRGIYDARVSRRRPKAKLPLELQRVFPAAGDNSGNGRLQGHPLHWFSPRNRFSLPHLLLVGDAAGVDPLFGEGIGPALLYGEVAAEEIQDAFRRKDFSFMSYRRRVLTSSVGRYLTLRWAIAWWCYRMSRIPGFLRVVWRLGDWLARVWPSPPKL